MERFQNRERCSVESYHHLYDRCLSLCHIMENVSFLIQLLFGMQEMPHKHTEVERRLVLTNRSVYDECTEGNDWFKMLKD